MKISKSSVEITEIPWFEKIMVQPDPTAEHGVSVVLDDGDNPGSLDYAEFGELIEALRVADRAMREVGDFPENASGPRTWGKGDPEPGPEVTRVADRDADRDGKWWYRLKDGTWEYSDDRRYLDAGDGASWEQVCNYAPITEAPE